MVDQVIFDMSLEAKENTLAIVENEYGDTNSIVILQKNSKNELIGKFMNQDCNDIEIPIKRVVGIGIKRVSNIADF